MEDKDQKATILIVDDAKSNLDDFSAILKNEYYVKTAFDGLEAIYIIRNSFKLPDLILLDITIPKMNGYQVCRYLKGNDRTRDIPVVFVSTIGDTNEIKRWHQLGAVDFLIKPCFPIELRSCVETHIQQIKHGQYAHL